MLYQNNAGTIENEILNISKNALDIYEKLNPQIFSKDIQCLPIFTDSLQAILQKHEQECNIIPLELIPFNITQSNTVLLAFSGGLDSMYQAFILKEQGYNVILFHCKNMNYYTNGKEYQAVEDFSTKYNFKLVTCSIKQNNKKDNVYKKYWKENSFKNLLLYSMMLDYCIKYNINHISAGDDLRLDIKDAVTGTNVADAKQVTIPFIKQIKQYFNINFIPTQEVDKAQRIKKLQELDALDLFYSCVNPGRFNQSNHKRIEQKYNVKLEKWNCGVCRKCAFHSLLRHYYLHEQYNKEFIDFCWKKICIGADFEFFNPKLSLEQRIHNLINY